MTAAILLTRKDDVPLDAYRTRSSPPDSTIYTLFSSNAEPRVSTLRGAE